MTFANPKMQPLIINKKYLNIKAFQGYNPKKILNGIQLENLLLEIKEKLTSSNWPQLNNVYLFVMGYDRISPTFTIKKLNPWVEVIESNNNFILFKFKNIYK